MAFSSLRDFVHKLETEDELVRISDPIKTELEITALADREMKIPDGGKALLLEKPVLPDGTLSAFPVLINALGSHRRMALALEVKSVDEVAEQIAFLLKAKPPRSFPKPGRSCGKASTSSTRGLPMCGAARART